MGRFSHCAEQKQPNVPAILKAAAVLGFTLFLGQRHLFQQRRHVSNIKQIDAKIHGNYILILCI